MAFDYVKFVRENQLTPTSRLKARFDEEEEVSAAAGKAHANNSQKLQQLLKQKDEILSAYKSGEISLDQYRTKIGNIPQQIKQLRLDLDAELNPEAGEDEEGGENAAIAPKGFDGGDADVSGVEQDLLRKSAGEPDEEAPSQFDADYFDNDEEI